MNINENRTVEKERCDDCMHFWLCKESVFDNDSCSMWDSINIIVERVRTVIEDDTYEK